MEFREEPERFLEEPMDWTMAHSYRERKDQRPQPRIITRNWVNVSRKRKRTHPSKDDSECRCIMSPTGGYCERILGIMQLDIPMEVEAEEKRSTNLDQSMMEDEEPRDKVDTITIEQGSEIVKKMT